MFAKTFSKYGPEEDNNIFQNDKHGLLNAIARFGYWFTRWREYTVLKK